MTDEKTLLEEILDVRKKIKNGLLDNDDTVHHSETENLPKKGILISKICIIMVK